MFWCVIVIYKIFGSYVGSVEVTLKNPKTDLEQEDINKR